MIHPTQTRAYWKFNFERKFEVEKPDQTLAFNKIEIGKTYTASITVTGLGVDGQETYEGAG